MNSKLPLFIYVLLAMLIIPGTLLSQTATPTQRVFEGPLYDPHMDNHLKAPPIGSEIGMFGYQIREVEDHLRFLGAKNHSYAFGKYSRMTLSVYLLTLSFSKERRLAAVLIEPRPPYAVIGPEARKFFIDIFVGENGIQSLNDLSMQISGNRLELKYIGKP